MRTTVEMLNDIKVGDRIRILKNSTLYESAITHLKGEIGVISQIYNDTDVSYPYEVRREEEMGLNGEYGIVLARNEFVKYLGDWEIDKELYKI